MGGTSLRNGNRIGKQKLSSSRKGGEKKKENQRNDLLIQKKRRGRKFGTKGASTKKKWSSRSLRVNEQSG